MLVASWRGARRRRSTGSRAGSSSVEVAEPLSPEVRGMGGGLGAWVSGWVHGLQVMCAWVAGPSASAAALTPRRHNTASHLHEWHAAP